MIHLKELTKIKKKSSPHQIQIKTRSYKVVRNTQKSFPFSSLPKGEKC